MTSHSYGIFEPPLVRNSDTDLYCKINATFLSKSAFEGPAPKCRRHICGWDHTIRGWRPTLMGRGGNRGDTDSVGCGRCVKITLARDVNDDGRKEGRGKSGKAPHPSTPRVSQLCMRKILEQIDVSPVWYREPERGL